MNLASVTRLFDFNSSLLRPTLLGMMTICSTLAILLNKRLGYREVSFQRTLLSASPPFPADGGGSKGLRDLSPRLVNGGFVEAAARRLQDCKSEDWDAFAQRCDASYQLTYDWLRGWSRKSLFCKRLELFEFYQDGKKIGQCAVGHGANERIFLDRLALMPGSEALWSNCMEAVLQYLGPGRYRYGWHLTLDQSREDDLRKLPGVSIESVRPLTVHAVDFSRWQSWDEYWASTSSNTRRNAKKGESANLSIDVRTGIGCLSHVGAIARLRSVMYERKGIEFHQLRALAGYVAGHIFAPQYRLSAIAAEKTEPLAGFIGYEFGTHTYYLAGGSRASANGSGWYLQKSMLQRAWERTQGRAKFVMGYVDYATHDEAIGGGLLRSRRSVNVTDYETSIVTFFYEGAVSEPRTRHH